MHRSIRNKKFGSVLRNLSCAIRVMFATTLNSVYISLDSQIRLLQTVSAFDLCESENLLPTLAYMAHGYKYRVVQFLDKDI